MNRSRISILLISYHSQDKRDNEENGSLAVQVISKTLTETGYEVVLLKAEVARNKELEFVEDHIHPDIVVLDQIDQNKMKHIFDRFRPESAIIAIWHPMGRSSTIWSDLHGVVNVTTSIIRSEEFNKVVLNYLFNHDENRFSKVRAFDEIPELTNALDVTLEIPENMPEEEVLKLVSEVSMAIDDEHRSNGGSGVKLADSELITITEKVPEPHV